LWFDKNEKGGFFTAMFKAMGSPTDMVNTSPEIETYIGRLAWTGTMDCWDFAVYRYSKDKYAPDEWHLAVGPFATVSKVLEVGYEIYPK
jgi:hypothetical protein